MNASRFTLHEITGCKTSPVLARQASFAVVTAFLLCFGPISIASADDERIVVNNVEALQSAMTPENAGRRIVLKAGTYEVTTPLVIPDGASLQGRGVMLGDDYPTGFDPSSATTIVAAPGFVGDLVTLGDGSRLSRLVVQQVEGAEGNAVVVTTRAPGDAVSATITECEIVNPNARGIGFQGPTGESVLVIARNPNTAAEPPPHEGAQLELSMRRSVVRSPGGAPAIFGINFASHARVRMVLQGNTLGGGLDFVAGVTRGDYVRNSGTEVRSSGNLYYAEDGFETGFGVRVLGGSDAPIPMGWPGSDDNFSSFSSRNDAIDGFSIGLFAAAGNLMTPDNGVSSGNTVELRLKRLVLNSLEADFRLWASHVDVNNFEPGGDNLLSVFGRGIEGSGAGPNTYAEAGPGGYEWGAWIGSWHDQGNRLLFLGRYRDFRLSNSNLNPNPHVSLFPDW